MSEEHEESLTPVETPAEPVAPAESEAAPQAALVDVAAAQPAAPPEKPPLENLLSGDAATPAEPTAEPAPIDPAIAEGAAPAPYEWQPFTLPEDIKEPLDEARIGALRELLIKDDLTPQARGQQLLDMHIAELRAYDERTLERQIGAFQDMQRGWIEKFRSDPEIGGAAARTHLALANAFISRFASPTARFGRPLSESTEGKAGETDHGMIMDGLRVTGGVNHPEIVRIFARAEMAMREPARIAAAIGQSAVPRDIGSRNMSAKSGNPGGRGRTPREMYDHPSSQGLFNGSAR